MKPQSVIFAIAIAATGIIAAPLNSPAIDKDAVRVRDANEQARVHLTNNNVEYPDLYKRTGDKAPPSQPFNALTNTALTPGTTSVAPNLATVDGTLGGSAKGVGGTVGALTSTLGATKQLSGSQKLTEVQTQVDAVTKQVDQTIGGGQNNKKKEA